MIRFGNITEFDAGTMRARAELPEDGIVTDWLPVLTIGSKSDKETRTLYAREQVAIWVDEYAEDGIILGSVYADSNAPPDLGQAGRMFSDGGSVVWDNGELVVTKGTTKITIGANGTKIERGAESLADVLADLIAAIKLITVTCAAPGSPSTVPLNFAAFDAVAARLAAIIV